MSGYRTIHRHLMSSQTSDGTSQQTNPTWSVCLSPCNQTHVQTRSSINAQTFAPLRLLTSSADGFIRAFRITDKSSTSNNQDVLDASALSMKMEQVLLPKSDMIYPPLSEEMDNKLSLGISTISSIRNYVGEDSKAGEEVSAGIRLDGYISVWKRDEQSIYPEKNDEDKEKQVEIVKPVHEFKVPNATGTTLLLIPPQLCGYSKHGVVLMAGLLDGSVAFICTGVGIPDAKKGNDSSKSSEPGVILDRVGSGSCPMSIAIQSNAYLTFAVGRKNGIIDVYSSYDRHGNTYGDQIYGQFRRCQRLNHHAGSPVRALSYSPDGSLLISGCDDGHIYIHDTSSFENNESILLVASILNAHKSYILSIAVLPDSRRFMTSSADKTVKVWNVSAPNSGAVHMFEGNDMIWDLSSSGDGRKCISCSDDGQIQIYSCDA